jgi:hypothetical protein
VINTLLGKIAGFFEKDFLFASFLPALLFGCALFLTLAAVVGTSSTVAFYESSSGWQHAGAAAALGLLVVVFAYVLSALRPAIVRLWSGTETFPFYLTWGFSRLGEEWQSRCFLSLQAAARPTTKWSSLITEFEAAVRGKWQDASLKRLDPTTESELLCIAQRPLHAMSPEAIREHLGPILIAYQSYSGEDLRPIFRAVKLALLGCGEWQRIKEQTALAELDRRFGTLETIRATRLGNLIEAYNQYPHKRYRMEPEIFWPRLRKVLPPEYWEVVQEPRILLDFALAMATLSATYAVFTLLIGPWLWYDVRIWLPLLLLSAASAAFFYRLGIGAADHFGELVRSSFDLFRLDLLKAMGRPHPATLVAEQQEWAELSRLAVYGTSTDFPLLQPAKS